MMAFTFVASPGVHLSPFLVGFAVPILIVLAPPMTRRAKRLIAGAILAVVVALGVAAYADDGNFVLVPPTQCATATVWDFDYWLYECWRW